MSLFHNNPLIGASGSGTDEYTIERSLRFNDDDSAYLSRTPEDPNKYADTSIDTSTAYRYHRILFEGDGAGGSVSEIEFYDINDSKIDASDTNNSNGTVATNGTQALAGWTAFNGTRGGSDYSQGVRKDPSTGFYISKDWGSGNTKTIYGVKVWGVDNYALAGNTSGKYMKLQGSNDNSSWTDLQTWDSSRTGSWTSDSANEVGHVSETLDSDPNRKTWTWSGWVKRGNLGGTYAIMGAYTDSNNRDYFNFNSSDQLGLFDKVSGTTQAQVYTDAVFRDCSAWYHIVFAVDTTQATGSDRIKIYVNGVQQTLTFSTTPSQNALLYINTTSPHLIGDLDTSVYLDGYLADVHFIDGQALAPTDFGEFDDNGVWQPIEYSGTYGFNGFHLDFSDNSSASAFGTDSSGNGNDWTVNNLSLGGGYYAGTSEVAVNGVIPNGGDPYWIDFLPTDADIDYDTSTTGMQRVHDGNTASNEVYWVGDQLTTGNVLRARFDLRDYPTITSLRVYGGFQAGYVNYDYQLLDSSKTPISGTSGTFGVIGWHSLTILGSPRYLEISTTSGNNRRNRLYAIEVNGTVLVNGSLDNTSDSSFDSPTDGTQTDTGAGGEVSGNYATLNPLDKHSLAVLSNGNLTKTNSANGWSGIKGSIGVTSGKYFFEANVSGVNPDRIYFGVCASDVFLEVTNIQLDSTEQAKGMLFFTRYGSYQLDTNTAQSYSTALVEGDTIAIALDLDGNTAEFYKNGVALGSIDISGSPLASKTVVPFFISYGTSLSCNFNFGQRAFAYSGAPSGYKALCTANLDDPTIADGSTAMDVKLYTGTEATLTISGYNFAPDLVWRKGRQAVSGSITESPNNLLFDTVRGAGKRLISNDTSQEDTGSTTLTAFTSDGFTLGSSTDGNDAPQTYVAWAWDAGTTTDTNNTAGSITPTGVRANPSAGFSIATFTPSSGNFTVGHGLNAAPSLVIVKSRTQDPSTWFVYHRSAGPGGFLRLQDTSSFASNTTIWQNTDPSSSVVYSSGASLGTTAHVMYSFAPVEGYSAFGSYTGNGSADGPFVFTGMRPRWVMIKYSSTGGTNWLIYDSTRDAYNVLSATLYPDLSSSETDTDALDFTSNGFKLRASTTRINASGGTFIYACFAENPFKTARAR